MIGALCLKSFSYTDINHLCLSGLAYFCWRKTTKPLRPNWHVINMDSVNCMVEFYAWSCIPDFSPLISFCLTVGCKTVLNISAEHECKFCNLKSAWVSLGISCSKIDLGELIVWEMDCHLASTPNPPGSFLQLLTGTESHLLSLSTCIASVVAKGLITFFLPAHLMALFNLFLDRWRWWQLPVWSSQQSFTLSVSGTWFPFGTLPFLLHFACSYSLWFK